MPITELQMQIIERQLGRKPRGLVDIAWQSKQGVPAVLQMRSLVDDQPFPTLYWLSSKDLYQAIAEIETGGEVKRIEQQMAEDDELRQAHLADQQRYVDLRWQEMAESDRLRIEELGFTELFNSYGIGGIRHWDKVRCLHMQYAYHLAVGGTAIGRLLEQRYPLASLELTI
ncbi:DUF501 domain-containing protein [Amphritea balenae]|uniref:DUF501 domain-containing protein n=1 Tax=Amphritea balenae TaxID=452629 RepID=A0A3P1SP96_9GAMM|nr:DUF501 domain-containing protein [Amphritea balenae]RRC98953.1 DUF501 domain-containing protein [Amphritea balenae]GGK63193.1 hypothetical protein GCM10007941_11640 [Amphritea balenae]